MGSKSFRTSKGDSTARKPDLEQRLLGVADQLAWLSEELGAIQGIVPAADDETFFDLQEARDDISAVEERMRALRGALLANDSN